MDKDLLKYEEPYGVVCGATRDGVDKEDVEVW